MLPTLPMLPMLPTLKEVYRRLLERYGPQGWWPGEGPLEVALGAILTQFTAWSNVEKALANLKAAGLLDEKALRDIPEQELAEVLRPSGTYRTKARKVKAFIGHLWEVHDGDLDSFLALDMGRLREELLSIHGIGEETADDILVYAAGKPSFVIDSYTRRILSRMGLAPNGGGYGAYQDIFHGHLLRDAALYNEYHALLDRHAKDTCRKMPACERCCILDMCPTGKGSVDTAVGQNL